VLAGPFATTVLLLLAKPVARLAALVMGVVVMVLAVQGAWTVAGLVCSGIRMLYMESPYPMSEEVSHWRLFLLNDSTFRWVIIDQLIVAGPWFLIAVYVRLHPMRLPADDGSPYPRRYCANCFYNLHGVNDDQCPECGVVLSPDTRAVAPVPE